MSPAFGSAGLLGRLMGLALAGVLASVAPAVAQPAFFGGGSSSVTPADSVRDAELDAMAAEIASRFRCLVCRGQSVQESSSQLAREMQALIRQKLEEGDSAEEIEEFFVASYGEFILLKPPAAGLNLVVYLGPMLVFSLAIMIVVLRLRANRRALATAGLANTASTDGLSERDRAWIDAAIGEHD